ncbi:ancient conserved domain protein 4 [Aphelenchoides avenae]|nr:ancient conserved domain protein 4 [Aphelenchus avenae]
MDEPKEYPLYTKNVPSDRFILILEGRAFVSIGQSEMTFEAGAWHCFGKELLDSLLQMVQQHQVPEKTPQTPLNTSSALAKDPAQLLSLWMSRNRERLLSMKNLRDNPAESAASKMNQLLENEQKTTFVPDYSATVRDDCTYLEISVQTYLRAFKSTLISRNRAGVAIGEVNIYANDEVSTTTTTTDEDHANRVDVNGNVPHERATPEERSHA